MCKTSNEDNDNFKTSWIKNIFVQWNYLYDMCNLYSWFEPCWEVCEEPHYPHWRLGGHSSFPTGDLDDRVFFDIINVNYMICVAFIPNLNLPAKLKVCHKIPYHHWRLGGRFRFLMGDLEDRQFLNSFFNQSDDWNMLIRSGAPLPGTIHTLPAPGTTWKLLQTP